MAKLISLILIFSALIGYSQNETKKITLDDIYKDWKFSSNGFTDFCSMKDGEHYCQMKKDSLNIYEYATGKITGTIVTSKKLIPAGYTAPIPMDSFEFSYDESRILFATDVEPIYRYSYKAAYFIYDLATGKLIPLSEKGKQRLAIFSPDGSKVAFVRENNLFVTDISTGNEQQVTRDGKMNEIINGATDWVYEEEFGFTRAFLWSPDSKKIAFYRFDESKVKEYQLTYYGDLYPEQYKYKYPKPGGNISVININILDIASGLTVPVDIGEDTNIYIPRIKWTPDPGTLALYRMNRHQNKLELLLADASTGKTKNIYSEENKYYIEINNHWYFFKNNKEFLLSSEKDGFRHLYIYDLDGKLLRQLTKGYWEVTDVCGVDEKNGLVYFASTEVSPLDRNIYSVTLDGKKITRVSRKDGTSSAQFSKTFAYFINRWSDINTPPYISVNKASGEEVRMIQDNAKLKGIMKEYNFSRAGFFSFETSDGVELNGWMLKPPGFEPTLKYPVMFTIYGGPGSQTVLNKWGKVSSWNQLWAQHGIIVVSVDNRGTGGRGEEFKKMTYLQLGKYETLDQVEAAKYLGSLPYVDKDRIGMWGWSYGGFMTISCMTKGADYFRLGVAVAPVTNWKYYDNIYTERFMRTPKENPEGYESNSPINHADKLKGKLLLIHGMVDDNVHPQNSYDMVTALVASDKQFEQLFYPNSDHGIRSGKNTSFHLYERMTEFILKNL